MKSNKKISFKNILSFFISLIPFFSKLVIAKFGQRIQQARIHYKHLRLK